MNQDECWNRRDSLILFFTSRHHTTNEDKCGTIIHNQRDCQRQFVFIHSIKSIIMNMCVYYIFLNTLTLFVAAF